MSFLPDFLPDFAQEKIGEILGEILGEISMKSLYWSFLFYHTGYFPTLETEFSLSLRMLLFTEIDSTEHSSMSTCCKYAQDYESNDVSMKQVIYNKNKHWQ